MPPDQQAFFTEFGLTEADLIAAKISWAELTAIFTDYIPRSEDLNSVAEVVSRILRREERTHSVRLRLKDPLHVMEKVVRKRQANADRDITASNYLDQLTDLVGVRVLHLYKEDWQRVHDHIVASFTLKEKPTIYHRRGDEVVGGRGGERGEAGGGTPEPRRRGPRPRGGGRRQRQRGKYSAGQVS